jgi:hypothetical protein
MNQTRSATVLEPLGVAPDRSERSSRPRLVVFVPAVGEAALLAARIHALAQSRNMAVRLVGVSSSASAESDLRRSVARLSAFLRDAGSPAETVRLGGAASTLQLRACLESQDVIAICLEGLAPAQAFAWMKTVGGIPGGPIYVFGPTEDRPALGTGFVRKIAPWAGSVAVILGFLWAQMRLVAAGSNPAQQMLLFLSLPAELALIWLCNSLLN